MLTAFDAAQDTTGHAHDILNAGYKAVGLYLRADRASAEMVEGLHSVGIRCFSVWERGEPTSAEYFTADQGREDAAGAAAFAASIGQPQGSVIFMAIDYDSQPGDVADYVREAHDHLKALGWLMGLYGNGLTLSAFIADGYCHCGWLSQSHGFAGYDDFASVAAIVQGPETTVLGMDVDLDEVYDQGALW